ncbi:efflux RND transporter permease subunit [Psychrobium sp. 1_MG-2023]|uniref:efflux RND transporter permease subunit n=1 Tax=Psychrobium sp. 1_MG-2023 TaxID=3062624 RepID=UPI000C328549|nr:efflux RND transporter permease subunit [Psychrobium sp. 1_MG-2023]MDP2559700.1 efflux RND transporter permease subunit [Psychrobium sp. 1_MG-2023]PKF59530.1 hydrophobe/amphiphile efflux-1 family RND transporter [Alteromonadales bacterium alter-6D02]
MAKSFIERPILAWVIAIMIMMVGILSIFRLPIAQYPDVAPPAVSISAFYSGASAKVLQDTVVQVIEQSLSGIDNVKYIASNSDSTGAATITVTFNAGTDPDIAQVQVQNKLQTAMPLLPQKVQQNGVQVTKSSSGFLLVIGFYSTSDQLDSTDIADYMASNIQDQISRVNGVGQVMFFGSKYAMRVWLNPQKLNQYQLTAQEVAQAIRSQNSQIAAGELGGAPAVAGQQINASIIVQTGLETVEEFGDIILRVEPDGATVRLKDVARVEIGGDNYQIVSEYNDQPAAGFGISLASGANALDTAQALRDKIEQLKPHFPQGLEVVYPYDITPFVKLSIESVIKTLLEAIILVFLVMYLFLQNFRATLIPTIAVPVVLLGTFAVLSIFGYSINTLTMFGMVLAIGLLVDDAIVVVENVERVMHEEGLSPKEATRVSMQQITSALIGIALVLSAVFVPMAFFGGSTGVIYRQFSITVVSSMVLSVIVALTLTPALCATLLKPIDQQPKSKKGFFAWFNRMFDRTNTGYQSLLKRVVNRTGRYMVIYGLLIVGLVVMYQRLPTSFLPDEDQGTMFTQMVLPQGASTERSVEVMEKIEDYYLETEKDNVESVFSVIGFSFSGNGQNNGIAFVKLKDWDQRTEDSQHVKAVAGRAMGYFMSIKEAFVFAFVPPSIMELGTASGFDFQLQDLSGQGHEKLIEARNQVLGMAAQDPRLAGVRPNGLNDAPQFKIDIDYQKAMALGVSIDDINQTFSSAWAPTYVNDFIDRGRVKRVYVQADAPYRMMPDDLNHWYVRNNKGEMVPFTAFSSARWIYGSPKLERYNGAPSAQIFGQAAPGLSSGDAMQAMSEIAAKLPPGFGFEWSGMSLQEKQSGAQAPMLYALSMLVVFLCLAALYESWSVPFAVMLVVPLGVLGALTFALGRELSNDVYFQVGLLTTIGLASKNAILIVEFARSLYLQGHDLVDATIIAAKQRLRPIIMTSMAFMLGVTPLVIATGAGSGSQNAIGTGVFGGMLSATVLAVIFVPVFFVVVFRLGHNRKDEKEHNF